MALRWDRIQLVAKIESTEGTPETLASGDVFLASNVAYEPQINMVERPAASNSFSPFSKVPGSRQARLSFDVELKGSGLAGTPPEFGKLLRACGMSEDVVANSSVTYLPASHDIPSLTFAWIVDGKKYQMAGARGTFKLDLKAGEIGVFHFEFLGTNISDADQNFFDAVAYQNVVPPAFLSTNLQLDSYSAIVENLSIDMGNELNLRPDANSAQGFISAIIAKRLPKLTLDPEDVLVSTKDWWSLWEAGSLVAFLAQIGQSAGNICTISAPKVQIVGMRPVERNGAVIQEMECELIRNSGDDELQIQFT